MTNSQTTPAGEEIVRLRAEIEAAREIIEAAEKFVTAKFMFGTKHAYPVSAQGCFHVPPYSPSYVGPSTSAATPSSERKALNG
jgi:hypothetical protein